MQAHGTLARKVTRFSGHPETAANVTANTKSWEGRGREHRVEK